MKDVVVQESKKNLSVEDRQLKARFREGNSTLRLLNYPVKPAGTRITNEMQTRVGRNFDPRALASDVRKLAAMPWFIDVKPLSEKIVREVHSIREDFGTPVRIRMTHDVAATLKKEMADALAVAGPAEPDQFMGLPLEYVRVGELDAPGFQVMTR